MSSSKPQTDTSKRNFLKYAVAGGVVVVAAAGGYYYWQSSQGPTSPPQPAKRDTIVIAWTPEIGSLHPYKFNRNIPQESPQGAIFDHYIDQDRSLNYIPGVVEAWEQKPEGPSLDLRVRRNVKFHDGTTVSADDVAFGLEMAKRDGMAYAGVWRNIKAINKKDDYNLTLDLERYDPSFTVWLGFLDALLVSKAAWQSIGEDEYVKKPIASGPYKVKTYVGTTLELEAFEDYWKGPPPVKHVVFKEVLDPKSRAAEIEAGTSDFTLQVDLSDFPRLSGLPNLKGAQPTTTDVAQLFVAPYFEPFKDERVRLALHHSIDKEAIVRDVLLGFGQVLHTTEAPSYKAYDPNFKFPYDPQKAKDLLAAAGYSDSNPLKITFHATRGFVTRDFEISQAIVEMFRKVGVQTDLQTITVAQFFDFRSVSGGLAALAFYVWSNATADPINSLGFSQWPNSPFSAWSGLKRNNKTDYTGLMQQATDTITPVFTERDEAKRIETAKKAAQWVVERGLVMPLFQGAQPLVLNRKLDYSPYPQGWIRPEAMRYTD